MDKIPFSIDKRPEIEAGKLKVVTDSGAEVKIVCWDADEYWPIVGIVNHSAVSYRANGSLPSKSSDFLTLFLITPEPELSEFEKEYIRLYKEGYADGRAGSKPISDENLKEYAAELLELANKELKNHEFAIFTREEFDAEIEEAKAEALKDLPRWKKCEDGNTDRLELEALCREASSPIEIAFRANGYRIFLSDLEVLQKED